MRETSRGEDKKLHDNNNSSISMNKTAMAIEKITGIDMHDSNGQVRDFYDIMGDIAGMWDKLDKKSKSSVAEAIAGKIIFATHGRNIMWIRGVYRSTKSKD